MKANKFINYSNLRDWGYSSSKTLAATQSGDLQISDTKNSVMTYSKIAKTKVRKHMEL